VLTSVVICGAGWVWMSIGAMESKADWLDQSQRKEPQLARLSEPELRTAASNLRDQVGAVQRFLGTRMIWSELLGELPQRLPQDVRIAALWGEEELGSGGKAKEGSPKKQKQRVLMDMTSSFPLDVPAPPELELVLQSVRQMESISARYPDVKLASLRLDNNRRKDATEDSAKFSILCLPKVRKAPTDSAAGGGSTEGAQ
jgi:hypothetical protein